MQRGGGRVLFSSQVFVLGFLPVCLAGFFLLGRLAAPAWALRWLLAASFFFYGWWNPPFMLLLAASISANFGLGQYLFRPHLVRHRARGVLIAGIGGNLALLGWFKYAGFLAGIAWGQAAPHWDIVLPLAISFFTFQQIMFLVDSFHRDRAPTGFVPYATFVAFFPHLIAGPIVRPREIIPQLTALDLAVPRAGNMREGMLRFLLGLAKKLVLADSFAAFADPGFDAAAAGAPLTFIEAWVAVLAYSLQLYFDFSGYSDMAIGLARMLNVRFPENFDSPYQARDIGDFWRRWHITLSQFLRDYVYIPLGGNRHGATRRWINLSITMLLGGLWHGASWNFVIWGGLHGSFLAIHAAWRGAARPLPSVLGRLLTLGCVVIAWVPFRAADLPTTARMWEAMAGMNGLALPRMIVGWWPALETLATPVPVLAYLGDARTLSLPEAMLCLASGWAIVLALPNIRTMGPRARLGALTAGFALTAQALFLAPHASPFLYFRF